MAAPLYNSVCTQLLLQHSVAFGVCKSGAALDVGCFGVRLLEILFGSTAVGAQWIHSATELLQSPVLLLAELTILLFAPHTIAYHTAKQWVRI